MDSRRQRRLVAYAVIFVLGGVGFLVYRFLEELRIEASAGEGIFLVTPYVQWGDSPRLGEEVAILWQAEDRSVAWSVETRPSNSEAWTRAAAAVVEKRYVADPVRARRLFRAKVTGLAVGAEYAYRIRRGGVPVFEGHARIPRGKGQPHRFVAFGDGGADSTEQKGVAYQAYQAHPDFVLITGDLVYYKGLMSEYLRKFFPIYNAPTASPGTGAPLLRSTTVLAVPGNHDLLERHLNEFPDGLAYFMVWALPLNGPKLAPGALNTPTLIGDSSTCQTFLERAGAAYPRMANYAFDVGDVHWTVLDTNPYADWSVPELRDWLVQDLTNARDATWRFVTFHQPPFHSSKTHGDEQRTRILAPLFEQYHVDMVFSGHIHNYQRSYPLRFVPEPGDDGRVVEVSGRVKGRWTLDSKYDGKTNTRPDGIIYLVTGGGGARLYNRDQDDNPSSWEQYTARFVSKTHSLTIVDVDGARITVRQVSLSGEELDRFIVTK